MSLPYFVSYPRCGSQWVQCALEKYLGKPRGYMEGAKLRKPALSYVEGDDFAWVHSHDLEHTLVVSPLRTIFMLRDPVDSIFSHSMAYGVLSEETMRVMTSAFITTACRFIKSGVVVRYESFRNPSLREDEFRKLVDFFGVEWDGARAVKCLEWVKRDEIIAKAQSSGDLATGQYFHPRMQEVKYEQYREFFRKHYAKYIYDQCVRREQIVAYIREYVEGHRERLQGRGVA